MDGLRDREQEVWCSLKLSSQLIFLDLVLDNLTQEKECLPVEWQKIFEKKKKCSLHVIDWINLPIGFHDRKFRKSVTVQNLLLIQEASPDVLYCPVVFN